MDEIEKMKVVAIREMAEGNATVGEMWKETKIFNPEEPIENILTWAFDHYGTAYCCIKRNVTITITNPKEGG